MTTTSELHAIVEGLGLVDLGVATSYLEEEPEAEEKKRMEGNEQTSAAFSVLRDLLSALGTLHGIDQRDIVIPEVAEQWKKAMDQGWQAHSALSEMLEAWEETLGDLQYSADEYAVDVSQEPPQMEDGPFNV